MTKQTPQQKLLNAIRLAESIPTDRSNFLVMSELLIDLRDVAKAFEATA